MPMRVMGICPYHEGAGGGDHLAGSSGNRMWEPGCQDSGQGRRGEVGSSCSSS